MKYLVIALALAAQAVAQAPVVSIRPNTAALSGEGAAIAVNGRTSVPVLGYLMGPGPLDLRSIMGTGRTAQLGAAMTVPGNAKRLFAPPREHYLLIEATGGEPLAVWSPAKAMPGGKPEVVPLAEAMANPEILVFSSRGDAAAVYSKTSDRLQVISGLPGQPVVASQPHIGSLGEASGFAVSDDGAVIVAELADASAIISLGGGGWQRLAAAYGARVLAFAPNTHNLVISDAVQQTLTLLPDVGDKPPSARVLAQGVEADRLAFTKEGEQLLAASTSQGKLWTIDLRTATPELGPSAAIDTLLPLRDGRTFLLSAPGLSLLYVPLDGDGAIGLVPVAR